MSDPEHFLTRWARRKREAADAPADTRGGSDPQAGGEVADTGREPKASPAAEAAEQPFDLSTLPSIDTITAETDIRAFFAPGVPAELRLAALRRAWVADPKIRDFVGLNDYDFDFHTPGAIPGFGPLEMTDELRLEVSRLFGQLLPESDPTKEQADAGPPERPAPPVQPPAVIGGINAETLPGATPDESTSSHPPEDTAHLREHAQSKLAVLQSAQEFAALHQNIGGAENLQKPARRGHGGALPK